MISLPDINVLIALAWPNHVHHRAARHWFIRERKGKWATCPLTQNGFIRISSNGVIIPEAVSPLEAHRMLQLYVGHQDHIFWADSVDWAAISKPPAGLLQGHRQVTDAYLVELAASMEGVLITLDVRLERAISGTSREKHVRVIG